MIARTISGIIVSIVITILIFMIFIVDWRKPEDIISQRFGISVSASDMRCRMILDNKYVLVDTDNYSSHPYLITFYQPIYETEVFKGPVHDIKINAVPFPADELKGPLKDAYCKLKLIGHVESEVKVLFSDSIGAKIRFNKDGEVVLSDTDKDNAEINILKNDDGSVKRIDIIQKYSIQY